VPWRATIRKVFSSRSIDASTDRFCLCLRARIFAFHQFRRY
jgi:hypothetical protein